MDVEGVTHTTIETNSVRLHVAQAGSAGDPLVILLHGYPDFWYGWRKQIAFLAQNGYRVWASDQRGYNLSEKPRGVKAYRMEMLGQDVLGLIDAAGEQQVYLVGHDWGAAVAWAVALAAPERLKKLVILNVPTRKSSRIPCAQVGNNSVKAGASSLCKSRCCRKSCSPPATPNARRKRWSAARCRPRSPMPPLRNTSARGSSQMPCIR